MDLQCPYQSGNTVTFRDEEGEKIAFKILHAYRPISLACVMLVTALDRQGIPEKMILKVVDPRWISETREVNGLPPWDRDREQQYIASVLDGHIPEFWRHASTDSAFMEEEKKRSNQVFCSGRHKKAWALKKLQNPGDFFPDSDSDDDSSGTQTTGNASNHSSDSGHEDPPERTIAEQEVFNFFFCKSDYEAELHAYRRLKDLQGSFIPKLFMPVKSEPWAETTDGTQTDYLQSYGVLVEYIDGISLEDHLDEHPDLSKPTVLHGALRALSILSYYDFDHGDPYPRNIVLRNSQVQNPQSFVFIDFSQGMFEDEKPEPEYVCGIGEPFHGAWNEKALYCNLICRIDGTHDCDDRAKFLRYTSGRYDERFEFLPPYKHSGQTMISQTVLIRDAWRLPHGQRPADVLEQNFERSQSIARIVDEVMRECNVPCYKPDPSGPYPFQAGWEPKAVDRIVRFLNTEDVYCDLEASWQAFCCARQNWRESDKVPIFQTMPKQSPVGFVEPNHASSSSSILQNREKTTAKMPSRAIERGSSPDRQPTPVKKRLTSSSFSRSSRTPSSSSTSSSLRICATRCKEEDASDDMTAQDTISSAESGESNRVPGQDTASPACHTSFPSQPFPRSPTSNSPTQPVPKRRHISPATFLISWIIAHPHCISASSSWTTRLSSEQDSKAVISTPKERTKAKPKAGTLTPARTKKVPPVLNLSDSRHSPSPRRWDYSPTKLLHFLEDHLSRHHRSSPPPAYDPNPNAPSNTTDNDPPSTPPATKSPSRPSPSPPPPYRENLTPHRLTHFIPRFSRSRSPVSTSSASSITRNSIRSSRSPSPGPQIVGILSNKAKTEADAEVEAAARRETSPEALRGSKDEKRKCLVDGPRRWVKGIKNRFARGVRKNCGPTTAHTAFVASWIGGDQRKA
ncbi:MAG: hypothetical protein Q9160_003220 [Pyrenula sp. 1 TL-2023]